MAGMANEKSQRNAWLDAGGEEEDEDDEEHDVMVEEDDEEEDGGEGLVLGACCNCGRQDESVRNIIFVDMRSPEPGIGCWGCLICDLDQAGAVAVLCDECMENSKGVPLNVCLGSPADNRRFPRSQLKEPFVRSRSGKTRRIRIRRNYRGKL